MCVLCLRPFRYLDKREDCSDFPEFRVDTQHFIATVCSLVYRAECGSSGGARARCREGRLSAASGGQHCAGAPRPAQRKRRIEGRTNVHQFSGRAGPDALLLPRQQRKPGAEFTAAPGRLAGADAEKRIERRWSTTAPTRCRADAGGWRVRHWSDGRTVDEPALSRPECGARMPPGRRPAHADFSVRSSV